MIITVGNQYDFYDSSVFIQDFDERTQTKSLLLLQKFIVNDREFHLTLDQLIEHDDYGFYSLLVMEHLLEKLELIQNPEHFFYTRPCWFVKEGTDEIERSVGMKFIRTMIGRLIKENDHTNHNGRIVERIFSALKLDVIETLSDALTENSISQISGLHLLSDEDLIKRYALLKPYMTKEALRVRETEMTLNEIAVYVRLGEGNIESLVEKLKSLILETNPEDKKILRLAHQRCGPSFVTVIDTKEKSDRLANAVKLFHGDKNPKDQVSNLLSMLMIKDHSLCTIEAYKTFKDDTPAPFDFRESRVKYIEEVTTTNDKPSMVAAIKKILNELAKKDENKPYLIQYIDLKGIVPMVTLANYMSPDDVRAAAASALEEAKGLGFNNIFWEPEHTFHTYHNDLVFKLIEELKLPGILFRSTFLESDIYKHYGKTDEDKSFTVESLRQQVNMIDVNVRSYLLETTFNFYPRNFHQSIEF